MPIFDFFKKEKETLDAPMKLEWGCCYVIQAKTHISKEALDNINRDLERFKKEYNVEFIIFSKDLEIIKQDPRDEVINRSA